MHEQPDATDASGSAARVPDHGALRVSPSAAPGDTGLPPDADDRFPRVCNDPANAAGIEAATSALAAALQRRGWMLATAESCTGGLIAAACTALAGSSAWFDRGLVTYSNHAKTELLGVPAALIAQHGAVSEPVARAMAQGAVREGGARVAVAVTGIAGPDGGSADKPVGTVWIAWNLDGRIEAERHVFTGSRAAVRTATVAHALHGLLARLDEGSAR